MGTGQSTNLKEKKPTSNMVYKDETVKYIQNTLLKQGVQSVLTTFRKKIGKLCQKYEGLCTNLGNFNLDGMVNEANPEEGSEMDNIDLNIYNNLFIYLKNNFENMGVYKQLSDVIINDYPETDLKTFLEAKHDEKKLLTYELNNSYKSLGESLNLFKTYEEKFDTIVKKTHNNKKELCKELLITLYDVKANFREIHQTVMNLTNIAGQSVQLEMGDTLNKKCADTTNTIEGFQGCVAKATRVLAETTEAIKKTPLYIYKLILIILVFSACITSFLVQKPFVCKEKEDRFGLRGISKNMYYNIKSKFLS